MAKAVAMVSEDERRTAEALDDGVVPVVSKMHFYARFGGVMVEIEGPAEEAAPLIAALTAAVKA